MDTNAARAASTPAGRRPMTGRARGLCIAAGAPLEVAAAVASAARRLGYSAVWTNDTPAGDGPATAAAMAGAATGVPVGIGAFAADRWPPRRILSRLEELGVDLNRIRIVIGAGKSESPLGTVERAVGELREMTGGGTEIGVAALGPKMCRLAGRIADLVLLNWATPEKIEESRALIEDGAAKRDRGGAEGPIVASYVRLALGPDARRLLEQEASRYARLPHYERHFQSMGCTPGLATTDTGEVPGKLEAYDKVLDETIVRAVTAGPALGDLLAIVAAAAPG